MARIYIRIPILLVPSSVPFLSPCATVGVVPEPSRRTFTVLGTFAQKGFPGGGSSPYFQYQALGDLLLSSLSELATAAEAVCAFGLRQPFGALATRSLPPSEEESLSSEATVSILSVEGGGGGGR